MSQRPERVQEAIRQEVSKIVHELKDPRLGFITITRVELTRDLQFARIYFSTLGDTKKKHLALKGLKHAIGFIRGHLADAIKMRYMPGIEFAIDDSYENTKRVSDILNQLHQEEKAREEGPRDDKEV